MAAPGWVLTVLLTAAPLTAATPSADLLVCSGAGASGAFDARQDPWVFAEIRTAPKLWSFGLWAAVEAGPHDWWAGGGIVGELRFFERWRFSPGFGMGGYADDGHGLNLGTAFEMRTQIELSRACGASPDGWRIALSLAHFSNAQIAGGANPGAEVLKLAVQIPLDR